MKIDGIENLSNVKYIRPVVGFVINNYDDEVYITELDNNIIQINDDTYAIYYGHQEYELIDEHNNNIFEGLVTEVPIGWREYIDSKKWVEENGIEDFTDYLEDVLYEYTNIEYVECVDGYNFYALS